MLTAFFFVLYHVPPSGERKIQMFYKIANVCVRACVRTCVRACVRVCNSLYRDFALKDILKLQRAQYCLARVITRSHRFSHLAPLLKSLHWLPARYRIIFKSFALPIKHFHPNNQLIYIHCSLLQDSTDSFDHLILIYALFLVLRQV